MSSKNHIAIDQLLQTQLSVFSLIIRTSIFFNCHTVFLFESQRAGN